MAFVCGKKRVPKPAAAMTAFLTFCVLIRQLYHEHFWQLLYNVLSVQSSNMEFVAGTEETQDEAGFLELLANDLEPFQVPRLPYHNWDEHIQGGMAVIEKVCTDANAKGRKVNTFMTQVAYLGHDAGYAHDLLEPDVWREHGSKEAYSAHIMGVLLHGYGMDDDFIAGVQTCIMFTKMDEQLPEDISEELADTAMAVRTVDLFNIFGSYRGFLINSFKLMEEDRIYGRERSLSDFKKVTSFVLGNFLDTDFIPSGNCQIVDALNNVERFMKDTPTRLQRVLGAYASRFSDFLQKDAA